MEEVEERVIQVPYMNLTRQSQLKVRFFEFLGNGYSADFWK